MNPWYFLYPSYSFGFKAQRNAVTGPRSHSDLRPDPQGLFSSFGLSQWLHIHILQNTYLPHTVIQKLAPTWKLGVFTTRSEFFVSLDKSDNLETLNRLPLPNFPHSPPFPKIPPTLRREDSCYVVLRLYCCCCCFFLHRGTLLYSHGLNKCGCKMKLEWALCLERMREDIHIFWWK